MVVLLTVTESTIEESQRILYKVGLDTVDKHALGSDVIQKTAVTHPFNTLRSYFSMVAYGGDNRLELQHDACEKEKRGRTDTERVRDVGTSMHNVTFRGRAAQRAQDDFALLADPMVIMRIIEPHVLGKLAEKVRVEVEDRVHLVVRHGESRVDGGGRTQKVVQDLVLLRGPGGMSDVQDPHQDPRRKRLHDEQGEVRHYAGPGRAKERLFIYFIYGASRAPIGASSSSSQGVYGRFFFSRGSTRYLARVTHQELLALRGPGYVG